jgi:hypothetical protein
MIPTIYENSVMSTGFSRGEFFASSTIRKKGTGNLRLCRKSFLTAEEAAV